MSMRVANHKIDSDNVPILQTPWEHHGMSIGMMVIVVTCAPCFAKTVNPNALVNLPGF